MNYIKKTLEYLFVLEKGKRFLVLFLLSLPIGWAYAMLNLDWIKADFIFDLARNKINLSAFTLGYGWGQFLLQFLAFIVLSTVFISIKTSIVTRSLRVGVFKYTNLFNEFNDNFFPALYTTAILFISIILYRFFIILFVILWQNINSYIFAFVLILLTSLIIFILFAIFIAFIMLYLPIMTFEGLKPYRALALSIQKTNKSAMKIVFAIGTPVLIVFGLSLIINIFDRLWLSIVVSSLAYAFLSCYLITMSMIVYCEIEQIKREDYPREYFFKRKG